MMIAKHSGVSLIEVLVAVFVLALGVIGAAGMHLKALRATHEAGLQSAALQLATELAERMRVHGRVAEGRGLDAFIGLDYRADAAASPAPPERLCYLSPCSPDDLARFDIYEAKQRLQSSLPGARLLVCRDGAPWDGGQAAFRWECDDGAASSVVIKIGWRMRSPDGSLAPAQDGQAAPAIVLTVQPSAG